MIGAMMAKKKVCRAFDALSRQDLDAFLANWSENATLVRPSPAGPGFPDPIPPIEGKEAIKEWYEGFIGKWELASFIIKNVCVKRTCPLAFGTNVVTVEWDLKLITKGEADESTTSGVTVIELKKGKATEVRVYECSGDPVYQALSSAKSEA